MKPARPTLRSPDDLIGAGLAARERRGELEQVAARYALALTPEMVDLIDPADPCDPIGRQFVPDAAELAHASGGKRRSDRRRCAQPGGRHRASLPRPGAAQAGARLRGLLPVLLPSRDGGAAGSALSRAELDAALDYIRAHAEIWEVILTGGDPLVLSPRRLGQIVAAARVDRAREDHPRAHPRAGGRAGAHLGGAGARAQGARQGDLCGAARQPCARAHAEGEGGLRAPGRCRHSDAEPDRAVARRQRRCGDARRVDARLGRMSDQALLSPSWRPRARHRALAHHHRGRAGADALAARPAVGAVPADLRARYSGRPWEVADRPELSRSASAATARRITRSRISTDDGTPIRRRCRPPRHAERATDSSGLLFISCSP